MRIVVFVVIVCMCTYWYVQSHLQPFSRIPSSVWISLLSAQWSPPTSSRSIEPFVLAYALHIDVTDVRTLLRGALAGGQAEGDWVIMQHDTPPAMPMEIAPAPDLTWTTPPAPIVPPHASEKDPVFFIYHAHPYESFLPELPGVTAADRAFDAIENGKTITSLGHDLAKRLNDFGIGAVHSAIPYTWKNAYATSRRTVMEAMQTHPSLTYLIDIHRDALRRDKTTLTTAHDTYARIVFVIGQKNEQYTQNVRFAKRIHDRIERAVPGLSRGIILKRLGSHGEFNQSLSPNSVLIEIGGVDNTLREAYRTIAMLALALRDIADEDARTIEVQHSPSSQTHTSSR